MAEQTCVSLCIAANRQCDKEESYLHFKFPFLCVFTYAATAIISVTNFGHGIMSLLLLRWCFCFCICFPTYIDTSSVSKTRIWQATGMIFIKSILLFIRIIAKHTFAQIHTHHRHKHAHRKYAITLTGTKSLSYRYINESEHR